MTMIAIVQAHCQRSGLPVPASAQSSGDPQVTQMVGLLQEFNDDLITRKAFQQVTRETTFVTTGLEDCGDINTLCPGFEGIQFESLFDRTQRLPLYGGMSSAEWQARKALNWTGPWYQFRIRQNRLLTVPPIPAGHTIAFEYFSNYFAVDGTNGAAKQYMTSDTDYLVFPDRFAILWLRWRWKSEKGFEYAEDFAGYERAIATLSARDNRPGSVNMGDRNDDFRPGVIVPSGSWPVSN